MFRYLFSIILATYTTQSFALITTVDKRRIVTHQESPAIQKVSKAIFTFFEKDKLEKIGDQFKFKSSRTHQEYLQLCPDEKFLELPAPSGFCTGFLIDSKTGLTAGHCTDEPQNFCDKHYVVFDYVIGRNTFNSNQVLECESVSNVVNYLENTSVPDQAFIHFKQALPRPSLTLNRRQPQVGSAIYTIGHPKGLPQIIVENSKITALKADGLYTESDIDTFKGNSGGPIINATTHEVEGIISHYIPRGQNRRDYDYYQTANGCFKTLIQSNPNITVGSSRLDRIITP